MITKAKCIKSIYKSTYKKNAFTKNKIYKILSEDDKFYYIEDSENRGFTISKKDNGRNYYFDEYFKIYQDRKSKITKFLKSL